MSKREEVEKLLRDYPVKRAEVENIKVDIDYFTSKLGRHVEAASLICGTKYGLVIPGKSDNKTKSSIIENIVIEDKEKIEDKLMCLKDRLRKKERELKRIDLALGVLRESEEEIVRLRYFKQYKVEQVAEYLEVSSATITRNLSKILSKLEGILFYSI